MRLNFTRINRTAFIIMSLVFCTLENSLYAQEGSWITEASSDGSNCETRHEHAYVKVGDKFYLLGGRRIQPVEIYDPATKKWTKGKNSPVKMHHFQAVAHNNLIYVIGAFTGDYPDETPLPNIYIYNTSDDSWATGPEIPQARRRGSAGVISYNNKLYVIAGIKDGHNTGHVAWFDEFDPSDNSWTPLADAPHARDHYHASIAGDKLVLAGGRRTSKATNEVFNLTVPEVDVYNFSTGQWTTLANNIPTQRAGTAAAVMGNDVIIIGGESMAHLDAHREAEALDITTGEWRSLGLLNQGRHATQAIVHDGKIYVAAGSKQRGSSEINSQEVLSFTVSGKIQSEISEDYQIYPNPFKDKIYIIRARQEDIQLSISNLLGVPVRNAHLKYTKENVDLSDLPEGIYFIKINGGKNNPHHTVRIIKN